MRKFFKHSFLGVIFGFLGLSVLFLTSCVPYYKLAKTEFPQGVDHKDSRDVTRNYVRTGKAFDQFTTQAIFDALWLSNDTRMAYIKAYSKRRGKEPAKQEALLKRQLEENKHWISFYVLSDIRDITHTALHEPNSYWTMYLEVECNKKVITLEPMSIKEIEVEPEFQEFFGKSRFNLFKNSYLVRFPVQDIDGKVYFAEGSKLTLVFSSPGKDIRLEWNTSDVKKHGEILKDEDFYWC
ncbi:MAG: hypothetical protein ABH827_02110 [bacterium]